MLHTVNHLGNVLGTNPFPSSDMRAACGCQGLFEVYDSLAVDTWVAALPLVVPAIQCGHAVRRFKL